MLNENGAMMKQGGSAVTFSSESSFGYGFTTSQNPSWNLHQVLEATGGRLLSGPHAIGFRAISTDSRTLEPGDLFVALVGENFDGHLFLEEAVRRGAAGVVVDRQPERQLPTSVVQVKDTQKALGDLAHYRRLQIPGLKVAAITGSCGKTTVKEMIAAILSLKGSVLKTKGNFNNLVGLPLSLLPVSFHHRFAVLEMGMNRPGEIGRLTKIAAPDVALITTIKEAHLMGLHSIEGVARAKAELFEQAGPAAKLVVNLDDPLVKKMAGFFPQQKITFGTGKEAMVRATHIVSRGAAGMTYTLHFSGIKRRVRCRMIGQHNVVNGLAAAAACFALGIGMETIVEALETFAAPRDRMELRELPGGIVLLNDVYNANPGSVAAAIEAVHGARGKAASVAVLGDMLELGEEAVALHRRIGRTVRQHEFSALLAIGEFAADIVKGARLAGMSETRALTCASKQEIVDQLLTMIRSGRLQAGDWLLLKGSRGMRMEEVAAGLEAALAGNGLTADSSIPGK